MSIIRGGCPTPYCCVGICMTPNTHQSHKQEIITSTIIFAFLNYYAPTNVDVFVECGMLEIVS